MKCKSTILLLLLKKLFNFVIMHASIMRVITNFTHLIYLHCGYIVFNLSK